MRKITVAAAQMGPGSDTIAENVQRMVSLMEEARRQGVQVLSFPELATTRYFCTTLRPDYEQFFLGKLPDHVTEPLFALAREARIAFVLPYAEKSDGKYYNSSAIVDASGDVLGYYRKMHLPYSKETNILEKDYFTPGDLGYPVFQTEYGRIGVQICYDRRFPEGYRALGLSGAEIMITPYNTPAFGGDIAGGVRGSDLCIISAAYQNCCFAIAVGKAGAEDDVTFIGNSFIAKPNGEVVARAQTNGDELVVAEIDLDEAKQAQERLKIAENRRPETYEAITRTMTTVA